MRIAILLISGLVGCASPATQSWTKAGATDVELRSTLGQCRTQASKMPLTPKMGTGAGSTDPNSASAAVNSVSIEDMASFRNAVNDCMTHAGWSRR